MTTSELISYIRNQIKNNISNDVIISKLTQAGWHREDIDEGFLNVNLELSSKASIVDIKNIHKTLDQYREPITDDVSEVRIKVESPKKEEFKQEVKKMEVFNIKTPIVETPQVEIKKTEIPSIETTKAEIPLVEAKKEEIPVVEIPKIEIPKSEIITKEISAVESPKTETPKIENYDIEIPEISTPVSELYPKEFSAIEESKKEPSIVEKYDIEIPNIETPVAESPIIEEPIKVETKEVEVFNNEIPEELNKIEQPVEVPIKEEFKIEPIKVEPNDVETKVELPKIEESKIKQTVEAPIIETSKEKSLKVETPSETYKIWTPMRPAIIEDLKPEVPKEENEIIVQNVELPLIEEYKLDQTTKIENTNEIQKLIKPQDFTTQEELIPNLISKTVADSSISENKTNIQKPDVQAAFNETNKNFLFENLPKTAMLSSYENDFSSASKEEKEVVKKKSFKIVKLVIIVLAILLIVAGTTWAFMKGYINIENLPFIKKDPKILLLNNSKVLSSLKSYKTETNIELSSPSFANITLGIIGGEVIPSLDKDSISISTKGLITQNEQGLLSDNSLVIKSSLLENNIDADIKNSNADVFLTVSDLSQVIKESGSDPITVKINEKQFDLIPSLFPPEVEVELKKINLYKLLSNGMLSYINNDTLNVYDEFINSVKVTEKGQENIKGIDTYHYSINTDRQLIKKLLTKVSDDFTLDISAEDKSKYTDIIGSITVDSFDVWIGKGDNNIYQYNIVLDVPLSKILSYEDKSIGDNKVKFSWKTTYYDFNTPNDISIPKQSTDITDFVKTINEAKIKNEVSTFKQLTTSLFNAEGSFGKISNPKGDCMNPISGSLFSPIGHTKGSSTAIGSISELLNSVLKTTNNEGLCYSTAKAWSFTIPITDNYDVASKPVGGYQSFFCVDNTGATKNLIVPPTGVVCE
ncbi:MAG TPA: hypothetical protein VIK86_10120 [Candidatus Paceibacterota bacterium]